MKYIISGTDRNDSRTFQVSEVVQRIYSELGEEVEILDLKGLEMGSTYSGPHAGRLGEFINKINKSEGLIVVTPEYNGSFPGVLKYFIDHWTYPESFEFRPVCFVGLGGRFGALRPVEHLQQVFGYRNAFVFPIRVFLFNIWEMLKEGEIKDQASLKLLKDQAVGFQAYIRALKSENLIPSLKA